MKIIYLAGGCFWGMEKFFLQFDGVSTTVGYANGPTKNPTYEEVKKGLGFAETVEIKYDEEKISLKELLDYFFLAIDPTSLNKQGADAGIQYRTGIYYVDQNDLEVINEKMATEALKYTKPIVVEVKPLENYYLAEEYHQDYLKKNPNGYCHLKDELYHLK